MDGTLINSSPAVVVAWNLFAEKYPLDLDDILRCKLIPRRFHDHDMVLTALLPSSSGPRNANHRRPPKMV
jgi:beta-phosphoglucomutase-like phosphatase (HAD superfamily)